MRRKLSLLMLLVFINQTIPISLFCQTLLTAQVLNVSGSYIEINRGSDNGLAVGAEGVVYFTERVWGQPEPVIVARVKVISVMPNTARLEIVESSAELKDDYLVDLSIAPVTTVPVSVKKKGGSKWWIWILVAAAGGGVAAAVGGGGGGEKGGGSTPPTTGTITYDIPAN
ncbi:MAG TPA: hypothetical protein VM123_11390 [archaeon]|nr:hypothetical protein [archaeon]